MTIVKRPPTAFEQRVYDLVSRVPAGSVTTYRALAQALGCGSAQAIGQALRRNPYAPHVPCHRVIRTDLSLGGYAGDTEGALIDKKIQLLAAEGVTFAAGQLQQGQVVTQLD